MLFCRLEVKVTACQWRYKSGAPPSNNLPASELSTAASAQATATESKVEGPVPSTPGDDVNSDEGPRSGELALYQRDYRLTASNTRDSAVQGWVAVGSAQYAMPFVLRPT